MHEAENPIPVTIIGGYLGAGKTTLVNHLLRNADGRKLAILVNEFGALPIDEDLIEAETDNLISLAGGCVCCSYGDDMVTAMEDLAQMDPPPDHVLLEASGVAMPGLIAHSISIMSDYALEGIVVLADALTIRKHAKDTYLADTIHRQLQDGDLVLLNKCDLVTAEEAADTQTWLDGLAPKANVLLLVQSSVPIDVVLRDFGRSPLAEISSAIHNTLNFRSQIVRPEIPIDPHIYGEALIAENDGLVRAKGFVRDIDGEMKTIQIVGSQLDVSPAPKGAEEGVVLIFTGHRKDG